MALAPSLAALAGCSYGGIAPVESASSPAPVHVTSARPDIYVVTRGETLYSIAWHYGFDYRQLGAWNGVSEPYTIYPGQKLRLTRPPSAAPARAPQSAAAETRDEDETRSATASAPPAKRSASPPKRRAASSPGTLKKGEKRAAKQGSVPVKHWQWPARGEVVTSFSRSGGKGIDIAGSFGQAIVAASDGEVVYSGSGLIGYGQLIIVKHNKRYLSAYAHNNKILVKEGDTVKGGQRIAEMGRSGSNRALLHFEIRRDGKPIDPVRYLPK